jgi:hypothetical protein
MKDTNAKWLNVTPPAAIVDDASFTTATIDTAGYDYAEIMCFFGAMDIAMVALKVQESDDSGMANAADVTGLVYGTSTNKAGSTSSLPSATADNTIYGFRINLHGRKRYLDVVATAGNGTNGTYMTVVCRLSNPELSRDTATQSGLADVLQI